MSEDFFQGATAVIGATHKVTKFGYIIFKTLLHRYKDMYIVPINPKTDIIDAIKCFSSIDDVKITFDTLVMIVNPKIGFDIVKNAYAKGTRKFWFQPGAESDELRAFCEGKKDILFSMGVCLLH